MKEIKLYRPSLNTKESLVNEVVKKYKFEEKDVNMINSLLFSVFSLVDARVYYYWDKKNADIKFYEYAVCLVTLGKAYDDFQKLYIDNNCLVEAYMLDCIGLVLLSQTYERFVKHIQKEDEKWAIKMEFFGGDYPVDMMQEYIKDFSDAKVSCNEYFQLAPSKSCMFLLPVSDKDSGAKPCLICHDCGNLNCMFRENAEKDTPHVKRKDAFVPDEKMMSMSYGFSRIFSNSKRTDDTSN